MAAPAEFAVDPLWVLLALAFLPPLLYLGGLMLRHPGKSAGAGLLGFGYGATLSLLVLAGIYLLLSGLIGDPVRAFQGLFADRATQRHFQPDFVLVCIVAPLTEELAKGFGVWLLGGHFKAGRDGAFFGAAVGLGFAGVETFMYLFAAFSDQASGLASATLVTILIIAGARSVSSALLHPAATGITGFGIGRAQRRGVPVLLGVLPYYALAVTLHGTYNYLAGFLPPQDVGGFVVDLNLPAAMLLASLAWAGIKRAVSSRS